MLVNFENYGNFSITLYHSHGLSTDHTCATGFTLKDCMEYIENEMRDDDTVINADIIDIYTGEIAAIIAREESEDFIDSDAWDEDPFIEYGYDPYMGCYSDDC